MGRPKLTLLAAVLCLLAAGCGNPPQETSKPADPAKLPPGMSYGYKPPK